MADKVTLPTDWVEMPETTLQSSKHKIGKFTFIVSQQPVNTRPILTLTKGYDTVGLVYLVRDVTEHSTPPSISDIIKALRALVAAGNPIPKPGDTIDTGNSYRQSVVDNVQISQRQEEVGNLFEVICNVREPDIITQSLQTTDSPRLAQSMDVPPWQEPTQVRFEMQSAEGLTFGLAYKTNDFDTEHDQPTIEQLRESGLASSDKLFPVANTAGDPFRSPPPFPKIAGSLHLEKGFLRGAANAFEQANLMTINDEDITIVINGVKLFYPLGTLALTALIITPKLYKQPIPWYPKTKHPLNKTYGELFYGYSGATSNRIAYNATNEIILAHNPMCYIQVSASFSFKPEGYGVWIANQSYLQKVDKAVDKSGTTGIVDVKTQALKEGWLDKGGKLTAEKKLWLGFTMYRSGKGVNNVLSSFFTTTEQNEFFWASKSNNFGKPLK